MATTPNSRWAWPIIPPSLPFVIYAMMANVSVGALFLAGLLPGILLGLLMMVTVAWFAHRNKWGGDIKFSSTRFGKALIETAVVAAWPLSMWWLVNDVGLPAQATVITGLVVLFVADRYFRFQAVLPIMTPVLLIGGMTAGVFTPTEGAIAASVWALFLGAITILVPVFSPIIAKLGIDPIHFGLVMVLNLMIGLLTPPVGMVLFVLAKVSKLSFERTVAAIAPWMLPLFATLILITFVPEVVLWLPRLLYP